MSFIEYFSEYFSFNEYFSAKILHPRKQEVDTSSYFQSCNSNKSFISQIYIELSVAREKSLIFFSPWGCEADCNFDYETHKSKPRSIRASE